MRSNSEFIVHRLADETVMVPTGEAARRFQGIVRLNETAAFLVEHLQTETTAEALTAALAAAYDVAPETVQEDVAAVLSRLRQIGALEE